MDAAAARQRPSAPYGRVLQILRITLGNPIISCQRALFGLMALPVPPTRGVRVDEFDLNLLAPADIFLDPKSSTFSAFL